MWMKKSLSRWWQDWAKIDFIALGLGLLISVGYVAYRDRNPNLDSPYLDLWSDLGMGLVGAWISVRLIDAVIGAREHQHSVRRKIWSTLNYVREKSQKVLPRLYDFDILSLKHELMFFRERLLNREKYLYRSEIENIKSYLMHLEELIQRSEQQLKNRQRTAEHRYQIDLTIDRINEVRNGMERELNEISYGDHENASKLVSSANHHKQAFSPSEWSRLEDFFQEILSAKNEDGSKRFNKKPYIRKIYFHEIEWLSGVEKLYAKLYDWRDYDIQSLLVRLSEAESAEKAVSLPESLTEHLSSYINSIRDEANQYVSISETTVGLIEVIDRTRFDLAEESEID